MVALYDFATALRAGALDVNAIQDAAQAYGLNRLRQIAMQRENDEAEKLQLRMPEIAAGLASPDTGAYRTSLAELARIGPSGLRFALPALTAERENAAFEAADAATRGGVMPGSRTGVSPAMPTAPVATPAAGASAPGAMNPAVLRDEVAAGLGLRPEIAAGVVSGLMAESQLVPGIQESPASMARGTALTGATNNRGGLGIAQWTGTRRDAFTRFAQERGLPVTDPGVNRDFLIHEMRTQFPQIYQRLQQARTPTEAANIFHDFLSGRDPRLESTRAGHLARAEEIARLPSMVQTPPAAGGAPEATPAANGAVPVTPAAAATQAAPLGAAFQAMQTQADALRARAEQFRRLPGERAAREAAAAERGAATLEARIEQERTRLENIAARREDAAERARLQAEEHRRQERQRVEDRAERDRQKREDTNPLGNNGRAAQAQTLIRLAPKIEDGTATPDEVELFRASTALWQSAETNPLTGQVTQGLPLTPRVQRAAEALLQRERDASPTAEPNPNRLARPSVRETDNVGNVRTITPPQTTPQALEDVRKAEVEADRFRAAVRGLQDAVREGGSDGALNAYFNNPRDPRAQRIAGAYLAVESALRGENLMNTGVLQPGEMAMLRDRLLSPQSLRGLLSSPDARDAFFGQVTGYLDAGVAARRRLAGLPETPGRGASPAGTRPDAADVRRRYGLE